MIEAQQIYIGYSLGQAGNKAAHSLEVGEGVSLMFSALAACANYDISEQEINYIKFRAHLHDGGRILNLGAGVAKASVLPVDTSV